jgi:hypothetical protein
MDDDLPRKINYFNGFFVQAKDLQAAETYRDQTRWLHNRLFHGPGVVRDFRDELTVTVNDRGNEITVRTGLAIDPRGRELMLNQPSTHIIRRTEYDHPVTLYVAIGYQTRAVDFRSNDSNPDYNGDAFIEEYAHVTMATHPPGPDMLELARIKLDQKGTRVRPPADLMDPGLDEIDTRARQWSGIARAVFRLKDYADVVRSGEITLNAKHHARVTIENVVEGERSRVFSVNAYPRGPGRIRWYQEVSSDHRGATEYTLVIENFENEDVVTRYIVYRLS